LFGVITVGGLTIYQFATDHNSGDSVLLVAAAAAGLLFVLCVILLPSTLARWRRIKAGPRRKRSGAWAGTAAGALSCTSEWGNNPLASQPDSR
jgi:hypothetical protein